MSPPEYPFVRHQPAMTRRISALPLLPFAVSFALLASGAVGCSSPPTADDLGQNRAALSPSPNDEAAFDYFVTKGLTSYQAAGIVGNLDQESQVDPTAVEPGGPGRGIAQWSVGGRWDTDANDNVLAYATAQGESSTSLDLQLAFIWYELTTFSSYGLASLRASTNVTDATIAFETDFEGCGDCDQATRIADAELALSTYGSFDAGTDAGKNDADAGDGTGHDGGEDSGKTSGDADAGKSHDGGAVAIDDSGGGVGPGTSDDGGAPAIGAPSREPASAAAGCALASTERTTKPGDAGWLLAIMGIVFSVFARRTRGHRQALRSEELERQRVQISKIRSSIER